jgi:phosphoenolpyruvate carboxykinase (ATP)
MANPTVRSVVETGKHTGRSPKDKFFVKEPGSESHIDWGDTNRPIDAARSSTRCSSASAITWPAKRSSRSTPTSAPTRATACRCASSPTYAWQSLFAQDLFIRRRRDRRLQARVHRARRGALRRRPGRDGTRTATFVLVNFARKMVLIGGTRYAGEIKKSVFTMMNYLMPLRDVLPMHCSANVGEERRRRDLLRPLRHRQDDALVRRESAADRRRRTRLVGRRRVQLRGRLLREDDQTLAERRTRDLGGLAPLRHGARKRRLRSADARARSRLRRADRETRAPPIRSSSSRTSCPGSMAGHPNTIVMLTADAFGVLPPISKLTPRTSDVSLSLRLHGEGRRHRERRHRTDRHVSRKAPFGRPSSSRS